MKRKHLSNYISVTTEAHSTTNKVNFSNEDITLMEWLEKSPPKVNDVNGIALQTLLF